jgi:hypothetical protein
MPVVQQLLNREYILFLRNKWTCYFPFENLKPLYCMGDLGPYLRGDFIPDLWQYKLNIFIIFRNPGDGVSASG